MASPKGNHHYVIKIQYILLRSGTKKLFSIVSFLVKPEKLTNSTLFALLLKERDGWGFWSFFLSQRTIYHI